MSATLSCVECKQQFEALRSDTTRCPTCSVSRRKTYQKDYEHGRQKGNCEDCGTIIGYRAKRCVPCGNKARRGTLLGSANPNWREGKTKDKQGYIYLRVRPYNGGGAAYRAEHILIWEEANGPVPEGCVVHHLNGIKGDNRLENLLVLSRKEHYRHHSIQAMEPYQARIRELEEKIQQLSK